MSKVIKFFIKLYKKMPIVAFDVTAIPLAWYLSYWARFNIQLPPQLLNVDSFYALLLVTLVQVGCYYFFKIYRGLWRFSSLKDLLRIIKAVFVAVGFAVFLLYFLSLIQEIPRSIFLLYGLFLLSILCFGRVAARLYWDKENLNSSSDIQRVLIIGAGRGGESLSRDLNRLAGYKLMGFIDDKPSKKGCEVHGVEILGTLADLTTIVHQQQIDLIFIAIPSANSSTMRRIVNYCEQTKVPFRTLPSINALAAGLVEVNALRKVNIEDLLGRDPIDLEWDKIENTLHNKRIIVTGGGGSIGSELCRQILRWNPKKVCIIDHSEFNLYQIGQELSKKYNTSSFSLKLISVSDAAALQHCFQEIKPHLVFHAAAYKHVPLLEEQIRVAVLNNILATQLVAETAVLHGVEKFILISTDKAVNPTNIMGATKRAAEIYCQNLNEQVKTQFITVRFGNVLNSTGSVLPLFQKQLEQGGPLTVTHPDIERYFMTIPEAAQLILQASVNGRGSEIFVLDMGNPIKIKDLASLMIQLAGKTSEEIKIEYIGLRPGEKLFEELFHASEQLVETQHKKLFKARFRQIDWADLKATFKLLESAVKINNNKELYILLKSLIPEFNSPPSLATKFTNEKEKEAIKTKNS